jgi:beta-galactosidase
MTMRMTWMRSGLTAGVALLLLCGVAFAQPDGSVGYWAGERGEALDLAILGSREAPPLPSGEFVRPDPNWGNEPVEELTDHRGRMVLNGRWNFTHAQQRDRWSVVTRQNVETRRMDERVTPPWVPGQAVIWFGRTIRVPEQWAGRRIGLDFKQVNRTVIVFVNDKPCGIVNRAGMVDITDAVTPGQTAKLTIWFQNTPGNRPHNVYSGIPSEVHLVSFPAGARVTDVYVQPSTRRSEITLDVEVSYLDRAGPLQLRAEMVNERGEVERTFTQTVQAKAAPVQTLKVTWPWPNPTLWDIGKPHLYTLRLGVKGRDIDDNYPQEFGFREFWIDGRDFYLNNTKVYLRTAQANWMGSIAGRYQVEGIEGTNPGADLRAYMSLYEHLGVNFLHWTPAGAWPSFQYELATLASQRGMLMAGQIPSVRSFADDTARRNFSESVEFVARQMRNFPSVVAWVSSGPPSMPGQDQSPHHIGRPRDVAGENPEVYRLQKAVDPARPIYWHAFTHGDIMSVNWYLNFIPQQERDDWVRLWTERGQVPIHGSEFGMPFNYTFMRKRTHDHNNPSPIQEEPFIIEYLAGWFGPDIYPQLTQTEWRFSAWSWNDTGRNDIPGTTANSFKGAGMLIHNLWAENNMPLLQRSLDGWPERTWRAWRTYGFSMMPIPWWGDLTRGARGVKDGQFARTPEEFQPKHRSFRDGNQPTLAWIAGPQDNFTAKDHSFWGGQPMPRKSLVLINDTRDPQGYEFTWTVKVGDQNVASRRVNGTLAISERKFEPITVPLPRVQEKTDGVIEISGKIGEVEHTDSFSFRVFPPVQPSRATVKVWDPIGKTTQMLTALGYRTMAWDGKPTNDLVVVGREALRGNTTMPGSLNDLVASGGRVLVMAQHPDWIEQHVEMRGAKHMSRQVFRAREDHPIMAGLDDEDLRDWGGASTLLEEFPTKYRETADYGMPKYGWRTTNTGGLTSGAPEVPHQAGWRPILVCEFALAYSPLMELDLGAGRVVWCSLDLEDYVPHEPVAVMLAQQALTYAANAPLSPRLTTMVVGLDRDQRAMIERMGLIATESDKLPEASGLAVIGSRARVSDAELAAFAQRGGRVFFLASDGSGPLLGASVEQVREHADNPNLLWAHIQPGLFGHERTPWTTRNEREGRDVPVPAWPELAGLGMADFHRRGFVDHFRIADGNVETALNGWVARRPIGSGIAIYCQVDPEALDTRTFPYLRLTRWRQTRIVAQMLANAGAQFTLDEGLLTRKKPAEIAGGRVRGYYHPDYLNDHHRGDNPFRYWRW